MKKAAIGIPLLLTGCAALLPQPKIIEKRFSSYSVLETTVPAVGIAVATADTEAQSGAISIKELSDRGQAALIEQTKGKPPVQLKAGAKDPGSTLLQNTIKRRVIISILPERFLAAGDRVDAIRVRLFINPDQPGGWKIASWTQASNGQIVIDVGKLTGVSSSKISAETGLKIADFLPDLKISGENSRSMTEEMLVKDTTDLDAAVDASGNAWLVETAGWRQSLAHNLTMDIIAIAPTLASHPIRALAASDLAQSEGDAKGQPMPPDKVRLREITIYRPIAGQAQGVCGKAILQYRVRHIFNPSGRATFSESDDVVQFIEDSRSVPFLFAPPPLNPLYTVIGPNARQLSARVGNGRTIALHFGSLEEATAFVDWLKQVPIKAGKMGNAVIGHSEYGAFRPLRANEISDLVAGPENDELIRRAQAFDPGTCPR